jgi:hypothetical protein
MPVDDPPGQDPAPRGLAALSPRTRLWLAVVGLVIGVALILFGTGVLDGAATDADPETTTTTR